MKPPRRSGVDHTVLLSVLNATARLVFSVRRSEHTTLLLRECYAFLWPTADMPRHKTTLTISKRLKVPERIQYRLCVLTHRCLHGTAPPYLAKTLQLITEVDARWRIRSASTSTLIVPSTRRSTLGDWAFPVAAARSWHTLPASVRSMPSLADFRQQLKTTLFQASYP